MGIFESINAYCKKQEADAIVNTKNHVYIVGSDVYSTTGPNDFITVWSSNCINLPGAPGNTGVPGPAGMPAESKPEPRYLHDFSATADIDILNAYNAILENFKQL